MSVTREKRFQGTKIRLFALFLSILLLGSSIAIFSFNPKIPKLVSSVANADPSPPLLVLGPPSKVQGLAVTNEGSGDILNITWQASPELNVSHYDLYRNSTSNPPFIQLATIPGRLNTFYQDTGLIEYENYSYYVIAVDTAGNGSIPSDMDSGTPIDTKPPGPPTLTLGMLPIFQIYFIITGPPDPDVVAYNLYWWNESLGDWQLIDTFPKTSDPQICLWPDPDPLPFGNHSFCATALDEKLQESIPSNIVNITIILHPPDFKSLTTNTNGDVLLNWSRNQNENPIGIEGYYVYRMNSSTFQPVLIDFVPFNAYEYIGPSPIAPYADVEHYAYYEYGVPNGNWTYYIKTVFINNATSYFSNSVLCQNWVVINDMQAPGPVWNFTHTTPDGIENITLSWSRPLDMNYGADVVRYEIYVSIQNFTGIPMWPPNATLLGSIYPNGTIYAYPATTHTFPPLNDGVYYCLVIAYDELDQGSAMSNVVSQTVDTTPPAIIPGSITDVSGQSISAGATVTIYVNVTDAGGIYHVWLNYTVSGIPQIPVLMPLDAVGANDTYLYVATFLAPQAGQTVNYTITVFDMYGHSIMSESSTFTVVKEKPPRSFIILLVAITAGTVCAAVIVYKRLNMGKSKRPLKPKETETDGKKE
ncbi:MAG: fibronectin type III domain-containing protein [Candidatus Helarchaeota archaeon]|nr:fibronectin type III domain-containing protein [Candidatus Helarchaeota archaeon]